MASPLTINGQNFERVAAIDPATGNPASVVGNYQASGKAVVTGSFTAAGQQSATFAPLAGRAFYIDLAASSGTFQLVKWSVTLNAWVPLKVGSTQLGVWTAPASALTDSWTDDEANTQYALQCTATPSAATTYGLHQ